MSVSIPEISTLAAAIRHGEGNRTLYPAFSDRAAWRAIAEQPDTRPMIASLLRQAETMRGEPIPELRASDAMRYMADGNRDEFERPYFSRRNMLALQVLALLLSGDRNHWMPRIIDLLAAISAEPFWCVPAHCNYDTDTRDRFPLDDSRRKSDLFASGTTATVGLTLALLGEELNAYSPRFTQFVRETALNHTIRPLIAGDPQIWWLEGLNNWTPWCAQNLLLGGMTLLDDNEELAKLFEILYGAVARFINRYPDDGFCDEGVTYWERAGGEALAFLRHVEALLPGTMRTFCASSKMQNMAEFPIHMRIQDKLMYNFADGVSTPNYSPGALYAAAEISGSQPLRRFAADYGYNQDSVFGGTMFCGELLRSLLDYLTIPHDTAAAAHKPPQTVVFPGRLAVLRNGTWTAVLKAGHNAESHNHNDLGHFALYAAGKPVVIDLGCGDYTRQYFSEERYRQLCTGAHGHNAPLFGGKGEEMGQHFHADLVVGESGEASVQLATAYPETLGIRELRRSLKLGASTLTVSDRLQRQGAPEPITLNLYSPCEKITVASNRLRFESANIELALANLQIGRVEKMTAYDLRLHQSWGDHLWHIELIVTPTASNWQLIFSN